MLILCALFITRRGEALVYRNPLPHVRNRLFCRFAAKAKAAATGRWLGPTTSMSATPDAEGKPDNIKVVMKFGGSSLADAERIKFVAGIIAQQRHDVGVDPMVVCSAMGSSTNQLLAAGDLALDGELCIDGVRKLHLNTCDTLAVPEETRADITALLTELEKLLSGILYLGELSPRSRDLLVSFGERMSVRLLAAQLNAIGIPAKAFDSWDIGLRTTSDFGGAEILPNSYRAIRKAVSAVHDKRTHNADIERGNEDGLLVPVVTGFIAQDDKGHVTTLGRGGSDLTAAVLGAACGLDEIQVWKDVDGMLTADPRMVPTAVPVSSITFVEASELAYFGAKILHPISMQPAAHYNIPVRIKNSYNPDHPGTVITDTVSRSEDHLVTAITTKADQTVVDSMFIVLTVCSNSHHFHNHLCIVFPVLLHLYIFLVTSTRMLGQYGFLAQVFKLFKKYKLSVDVVATSEISISLTLSTTSNSERQQAVRSLVEEMTTPPSSLALHSASAASFLSERSGMADVVVRESRAIISLIANVDRSSDVMAGLFQVLTKEKVQVEMLSQGASKVNISLIVKNEDLQKATRAIHDYFFAAEVAVAGPFVPPPAK